MSKKSSTRSLPTLQPAKAESAESSDIVNQQAKNEAAIKLLTEWLADESGYDEETWPKVKQAIEENRLSSRRRFND